MELLKNYVHVLRLPVRKQFGANDRGSHSNPSTIATRSFADKSACFPVNRYRR